MNAAFIHTITGDISPLESGFCLAHEHVLGQPPAEFVSDDLKMDSRSAALDELRSFYAAGGRLPVEMTTPELRSFLLKFGSSGFSGKEKKMCLLRAKHAINTSSSPFSHRER